MIERLLHLTLIFWIILDAVGNVPIFVSVLKHVDHSRLRFVIMRELLIALAVMIFFLFFGKSFFDLLHIQQDSLEITGGIILLLIAMPMIFTPSNEKAAKPSKHEPLIVPLAVPSVAGPAMLAAITIYSGNEGRTFVLIAILLAWGLSVPIILAAPFLKKRMGENALRVLEHFFGYLLILIAGQMILHGALGVTR